MYVWLHELESYVKAWALWAIQSRCRPKQKFTNNRQTDVCQININLKLLLIHVSLKQCQTIIHMHIPKHSYRLEKGLLKDLPQRSPSSPISEFQITLQTLRIQTWQTFKPWVWTPVVAVQQARQRDWLHLAHRSDHTDVLTNHSLTSSQASEHCWKTGRQTIKQLMTN